MAIRKKPLIVLSSAALILVITMIFLLMVLNRPTPTNAQAVNSEFAQSISPSASPPAKEAIDSVQAALSSGSDEKLAPLVAASPGEPLRSGFADELKALGLSFDYSSMKQVADSTWSVAATDKSGKAWDVGLVRDDAGALKILYAEAAK